MNEQIVRREDLSRQASDWRECRLARVVGSLTDGMSYDEVQREYYLGIRAQIAGSGLDARLHAQQGSLSTSGNTADADLSATLQSSAEALRSQW